MTNLRTYPEVAVRLARNDLQIHGWYYDIGRGQIRIYNQESGEFSGLDHVMQEYGIG